MSNFKPFLTAAMSGDPLGNDQMRDAMSALLSGDVSDIEIAAFLSALRTRGETVDEIAAAAMAMRDKAIGVQIDHDIVDTCGTGGDGADTFNISTAAAIIAAGAGVRIAKHGNKAASSQSGSSQVLEALGVNIVIPPARISECVENARIGFMFAAAHHGAVAHVANVRKTMGVRTIFNVLGPLTNPAGARRQVMGVFSKDLVRPIAEAMPKLGVERAFVVHGSDGLDELTTTGETFVASLEDGKVHEFTITPEDAGLKRAELRDLKGGNPDENAKAIKRILAGEHGAFRDIAVLNAAASLVVAGSAKTLNDGARLAEAAIDNGKAAAALDTLIKISNAPS